MAATEEDTTVGPALEFEGVTRVHARFSVPDVGAEACEESDPSLFYYQCWTPNSPEAKKSDDHEDQPAKEKTSDVCRNFPS
jgi:hypothetical protein